GPFPSPALTAPTVTSRTLLLPPSRGETLRPRGFSHRLRDAKSLVYLRTYGRKAQTTHLGVET
ncbi:MAG TPA: hypothetical protein VJY33_04740, partial [Isosphaeraceae bacterium]|nr:hypothetical protein [Isosphaeraceae bacterium]